MAQEKLWQVMVEQPNPDRKAVALDTNGGKIYTGAETVRVPWNGDFTPDSELAGVLATLREQHPDKSFSVKQVG
jgi:hypothetical protein